MPDVYVKVLDTLPICRRGTKVVNTCNTGMQGMVLSII